MVDSIKKTFYLPMLFWPLHEQGIRTGLGYCYTFWQFWQVLEWEYFRKEIPFGSFDSTEGRRFLQIMDRTKKRELK
jgi:hypothetical protein